MSATAIESLHRTSADRAAINRANSQHSTGPRTLAGKQRSSINALRHGLTAASAVLPTEDPAAYQRHCRQLFDEYQPATPTETQLVAEIADTAWRLNRIPLLEAELFSQTPDPESLIPMLATLGLHSTRLSRQFQKTLDTLRDIQADRAKRERRDLRAHRPTSAAPKPTTNFRTGRPEARPLCASYVQTDAAALLELHKHKGVPWQPTDHGFVFQKKMSSASPNA